MATPVTSRAPAPRREAARPSVRAGSPAPSWTPSPHRPRPGDGKILAAGFLASAVFHLLVIVLYSLRVGEPGPGIPGVAAPRQVPEGIEVIRLVEVPGDLPEPEAPPAAPERATPVVARPAPGPAPPAAAAPGDEPVTVAPGLPPVAERLRPGEADERLWRIDPDLSDLSDQELARLLLAWTIEEMGDSALAAEARARAGTDWTYTDDDGKKWGISQGRLHLGDLTIPLPFFFSPPPGSDAARRAWEDAEIARGAAAAAARENMQDRVRAIRERRDRERELRRPPPPDTTRGGG